MNPHLKHLARFGEWFLKIEGSWHFVGSTISIILLVHRNDLNAASLFSPLTDYIAGFGTLFFGWLLGVVADERQ